MKNLIIHLYIYFYNLIESAQENSSRARFCWSVLLVPVEKEVVNI